MNVKGSYNLNISYDDAGNLLTIDYPTSPDVSFTYNEVNRMQTMTTVGLGTTTFTYTHTENPTGESGLWPSDGVSYGYHASAPGLRTALTIAQPAGSWGQTYGFDAARRMQTVAGPSGTFTYTYLGAGTVWTNLALPNTSAITNLFDTGGRMMATRLKNSSGTILNKHDYLYNGGGQRQQQTVTSGAYTTYGFDNDGQLASSLGYTSGGTPVASEQLGFGYDASWNMVTRTVNGVSTTYSVDTRNQLVWMSGPDYFTNDVNGNLTYWGSPTGWQRNLSYDDENRLVGVTVPGYYIGTYQYDGLSRLRVRTEQRWNGSAWVNSTIRYLYDGMCILQERDGSNVPQVTYTRGKDLSGTLEGAGGIGGLLARSHGYSGGTWSTHNFYHADALGNVTYLVSSAQGMVANYRYDPYGRTIGSGGTLATANVFRFSSKLAMDVSAMNLYYYGYRFYEVGLQRWINRDPIQENGGYNLYSFVGNNPISWIDTDGEKWWEWVPLVSTGTHAYQRLFGHVPGLSPQDYADCKGGTPEECQRCITAKLAQYLSNYTGVSTGADATKALIGGTAGVVGASLGKAGLRGGVGGLATGGVLLVDAAVDAGIVFDTIFDMKDAAKDAAKNLCGCDQ